mmetsp:Transcript_13003/g.29514  ORF Transcript_13003/g.29514 Transcript_13003/m.29514 type:complete len:449 (+) Transcript_13003:74-1420(+)
MAAARGLSRVRCASHKPAHSSRLHSSTQEAFVPFSEREHGLFWHRNKDSLLSSSQRLPGSVLVAAKYGYIPRDGIEVREAQKYSSFNSHDEYWGGIEALKDLGVPHTWQEVIPAEAPRCLYFDLDGPVALKPHGSQLAHRLKQYIEWAFSHRRAGWGEGGLQMARLVSNTSKKYSEHILFPQIQFQDFETQSRYMGVLLKALPALQVEAQVGSEKKSIPILDQVVDKVPYMRWQHFRGPHACKLSEGVLVRESEFEPKLYFNDDPLANFVTYCNNDVALPLPSVEEMLEWNPEVKRFHKAPTAGGDCSGHQDEVLLYSEEFQKLGHGFFDAVERKDVDVYEAALVALHPKRASQWWSWFRVCGITCRLLEKHGRDSKLAARIWRAHHQWASQYATYSPEENEHVVMTAVGKRTSGLQLLIKMVAHDNPEWHVRSVGFERPGPGALLLF